MMGFLTLVGAFYCALALLTISMLTAVPKVAPFRDWWRTRRADRSAARHQRPVRQKARAR